MMTNSRVWSWVPTLYVAEAVPYVAVNVLTVLMYTQLDVDLVSMTFYTGWLYLPWVIKPFWSPFVDIFSTKRKWVLAMQLLMGVAFSLVALTIPTNIFFATTLALFWFAAFCSATHDIAADGYYMLALTDHQQAAFTGLRNTAYRVGSLLVSGVLVYWVGVLQEGGGTTHEAIVRSWTLAFWVIGLAVLGLALYHIFLLPKVPRDTPAREKNVAQILRNFGATFATFFTKPGIVGALVFILLYRLPEALCIKLVVPFLNASRAEGGLGMTASQIGFANGTVGVVALLLGGIIGGLAIARGGLKKWLYPMALSLTLPCVLYCVLAMAQPATDTWGLVLINAAIFVEQFGYGFGFTAFMLYLIYFSEGKWKTSHYAFCTGFMALGMMLPGMAAGWLHEQMQTLHLFSATGPQGYINFFWLVVLCSLVTLLSCTLIKINPHFGRKSA